MPTFPLIQLGLAVTVLAVMARWLDTARGATGCFFTFHRAAHNNVWEDLPNRNFYLDLDFLDNLIAHLKTSGRRIVTVEEGRRLAADPRMKEPFINFSIDDCYRDTYELVLPLFRKHGVPITLFVTTGIPDRTLPLYWAGLEDGLKTRDLVSLDGRKIEISTPKQKSGLYQMLQAQWDGPLVGEHYKRFCADNDITEDEIFEKHGMTWDMLTEIASDPLVEIGSHTVSHARISSLSPEAALRELVESRQRLREKLNLPINHFAFPYGRVNDCGPRDFAIARRAGYESVGTTTKGLLRRGSLPYAYPRVTLNGAHRNMLVPEIHISGASSFAARMLGRV